MDDEWRMESGGWWMEDEEWGEDGGWRIEDERLGRKPLENRSWKMAHGR